MRSRRFGFDGGPDMLNIHCLARLLPAMAVLLFAWDAQAQSFRVPCPAGTDAHPATVPDATYSPKTIWGRTDGLLTPPPAMANPAIKCQQISGGDGFATMGDGTQTYLFGFGPLSGLADIVKGLPGTQPASGFNLDNSPNLPNIGDPQPGYGFNGAVGLVPDPESDPAGQLTGHVDPRLI